MKPRQFILAMLLAAPCSFAFPAFSQAQDRSVAAQPDSDSLAIAREILDLGLPRDVREQTFFAAMDQMMAQMGEAVRGNSGEVDPGIAAITDRHIAQFRQEAQTVLVSHLPSLMDGWATAYANMFTLEELRDIRTFVATPSGQRFFQLSSAVMAEPAFASANQAYMNQIMSILPGMQERLRADILDYLALQSESGKSKTS